MPIHRIEYSNGDVGFQWGNHGHVYLVSEEGSEAAARAAAGRQAAAAHAHGYRDGSNGKVRYSR
jgi:hypothetical protein